MKECPACGFFNINERTICKRCGVSFQGASEVEPAQGSPRTSTPWLGAASIVLFVLGILPWLARLLFPPPSPVPGQPVQVEPSGGELLVFLVFPVLAMTTGLLVGIVALFRPGSWDRRLGAIGVCLIILIVLVVLGVFVAEGLFGGIATMGKLHSSKYPF